MIIFSEQTNTYLSYVLITKDLEKKEEPFTFDVLNWKPILFLFLYICFCYISQGEYGAKDLLNFCAYFQAEEKTFYHYKNF